MRLLIGPYLLGSRRIAIVDLSFVWSTTHTVDDQGHSREASLLCSIQQILCYLGILVVDLVPKRPSGNCGDFIHFLAGTRGDGRYCPDITGCFGDGYFSIRMGQATALQSEQPLRGN